MKRIFFLTQIKDFHKKGFALSLVLKVRVFGTRKWLIFKAYGRTEKKRLD